MNALERAVDKAGSQRAFGERVGVNQSVVSDWLRGVLRIPVKRCKLIEYHFGEPCEELRPDLKWSRMPDPNWPHPGGKPFDDTDAQVLPAAA